MEYKQNWYCYNGERIMRKLAGLLYPMVVSDSPWRWLKFRRTEYKAYSVFILNTAILTGLECVYMGLV